MIKSHLAFDLLDNIDIQEHTDRQTSPSLDLGTTKVKARVGLSVCFRMSILSPKSKVMWLSAKILIKIRTLSTDSAILIWIFINNCPDFISGGRI